MGLLDPPALPKSGGTVTPAGATGSITFDKEGDSGITSVLPPMSSHTPQERLRMTHPDPAQAPGNFALLAYAAGFGVSYDGPGPIQFSAHQVAINGLNADLPGGNGTAGQLVIADEYDSGGAFIMSHRYHPTKWLHENYLDFYNERWDGTAHGSLHLRVLDAPRTLTNCTIANTTELFCSTGAFTSVDLGRRVSGANVPAFTYITNINSSQDVTLSAAATNGTGLSVVVGREQVSVWVGDDTVSNQIKQLGFGRIGPSAESGILFGSAEDTSLYRSGVAALTTNGSLQLGGAAGTGLTIKGGQRIAKTSDLGGPLQFQEGGTSGFAFINAAGNTNILTISDTGVTVIASTLTVGGAAGTGVSLKGQRIAKTSDVSGALQLQDGSGSGVQILNGAGSVAFRFGNAGGFGAFAHAAPTAQPAAPVTLADVIAVLQSYGMTA